MTRSRPRARGAHALRTRTCATLALLAPSIAPSIAPRAAAAQPALPPSLAGTWRLDAARSDDPRRAVDATVASINVLMRGPARRRLQALNVAYPGATIVAGRDSVRVAFTGIPPIVTPRTGAETDWRDGDGQTFRVRASVEPTAPPEMTRPETPAHAPSPSAVASGPRLLQRLVGPAGERWNLLGVTADGTTLVVDVLVTAPRLRTPVRYRLVYGRAP